MRSHWCSVCRRRGRRFAAGRRGSRTPAGPWSGRETPARSEQQSQKLTVWTRILTHKYKIHNMNTQFAGERQTHTDAGTDNQLKVFCVCCLTMSSSRYTDSLLRVVILSVSWPIFKRLDEANCAHTHTHTSRTVLLETEHLSNYRC